MRRTALFAGLSALMSLIYLLSIPACLILVFVDWRVSVALIPVAILAACAAKWFNGCKLRLLYGNALGSMLNDFDWETGRKHLH